METIGERIAKLMKNEKLTQKELATMAGVTRIYVVALYQR